MSLDKLGKQVRREIKAHPAKAGVLAVVGVVAIWFWAPLVAGWFGAAKPKSAATAPAATAAPTATATNAPVPSAPEGVATHWRKIIAAIEQDHLMRPAEKSAQDRNPFHKTVAETPVAEKSQEAEKPVVLDAESLGLVLTSTLIGNIQNAATINGRAYVLSHQAAGAAEPVTVEVDAQGKKVELNLTAIEPNKVILEFEGQKITVVLKEKPLNPRSTFEVLHGESTP